MRESIVFSFRFGEAGRVLEFRVGPRALKILACVAAVGYILGAHGIYDYRENRTKAREIGALRNRVSEQNLALYRLNAKFESLTTEVERIRSLDARVKSLVRINESLKPVPGKADPAPGIGGLETPRGLDADRMERLLDLRFETLRESILVDGKNLEAVQGKLDARRIYLESVPALWPVRGFVSSAFGVRVSPFTETEVFHHGLDINAPPGTPVRAATGGKVVRSGFDALAGNLISIDHGNGYQTVYAHLSERWRELGETVLRGDEIGTVGDTGRTTGPHLHYEVRVNGLPVNPSRFLN